MYKKILSILMLICAAGALSMSPLHEAIKRDSLADVQKILREESDLLESFNAEYNYQTPIHYAANLNRETIAQFLIDAGANLNTPWRQPTPLHYAAMNKNAGLATMLLHNGALPNPVNPDNGFTPFHYAAFRDASRVIRVLCNEGADVTIKNAAGITPLETALKSNSLHAFRTLLMYDSNRSNNLWLTALTNYSDDELLYLLIVEGVPVRNQTPKILKKITKLLESSSLTHVMLNSTISRFMDALNNLPHDTEDYLVDIKSTLIVAYAQGYLEHAHELEKHIQGLPLHAREVHNYVLQSAVSRGDFAVCTIILTKLPKSEPLKNHSFLLNLAINLKHKEIATLLLQHALQNQALESTLKNAVSSRHCAAIEALLHAGAPTSATEDFLNDPARKHEIKVPKALYATLKARFTAHTEALRNPQPTSYLSLLGKDIREDILELMVKTANTCTPQ